MKKETKKKETKKATAQLKPQPTFADTVRQHFLGKKVRYCMVYGNDPIWVTGTLEDATPNALMIRHGISPSTSKEAIILINPRWISDIRED